MGAERVIMSGGAERLGMLTQRFYRSDSDGRSL